jgi:hypothetical protein
MVLKANPSTLTRQPSNQALQPTADRIGKFAHDNFNIEIRSTARFRQRWLSLVSLGALTRMSIESDIVERVNRAASKKQIPISDTKQK